MNDRSQVLTEQRLAESMNLDAMPLEEAVRLMSAQDAMAVAAVRAESRNIAQAVTLIVSAFKKGGRLFYVGAGSSGRLGVLDASECPPTFRSEPESVQGIIAGGDAAMFRAQEGVEDDADAGAAAMDAKQVSANDVVVGIAAGGTTPFVHGALRRAIGLGANTVFLSCVHPVADEPNVNVVIRPLTGPEVITGSTRLKAGTATKLVLNMLSTLAMVQMGKVYGNLMVDLRATNQKLWDRGARIVATVTGLTRDEAMEQLKIAGGHVKAAIVMVKLSTGLEEAKLRLTNAAGSLRGVLEQN